MWLRVRKQLRTKDAERIRENCKKTDFLLQLNDGNFLCKDILSKRIAWEKTTDCIKILVFKNVGPLKSEVYELSMKNGPEEYLKTFRNYQKNNFRIILTRKDVNSQFTNIFINIDSPDATRDEYFLDPRMFQKENIFSLATYFYNKFDVYKKIYEILSREKNKLYENIGKAYTDDLISLFSVEKESENIKDYKIPSKNIPVKTKDSKTVKQIEEIYEDMLEIEDTHLQLGQAREFFFEGSSEKSRIYLSLDKDNILYLECPIAFISTEKINKLTSFIDKQLNAWLKDLEKRTNFGLGVCEKVKTKILVDNI